MSDHVAYDDIPQTARDVLDEIYLREGVEIWWNARSTLLSGLSARDCWLTPEGRRKVLNVVEMLAGGNFA